FPNKNINTDLRQTRLCVESICHLAGRSHSLFKLALLINWAEQPKVRAGTNATYNTATQTANLYSLFMLCSIGDSLESFPTSFFTPFWSVMILFKSRLDVVHIALEHRF